VSPATSIFALVIAASPADPGPGPAGDPGVAQQAAREAFELAQDGRVGEARARLREAYTSSGDAALLFIRGTFERDQGHCELSIDYFGRFLATDPPAQDAARAQAEIETCEELLASQPPPPAAEQTPPEPTPTPAPTSGPSRPPFDRAAVSLVAIGGGLGLVGAGLLVGAAVGKDRALDQAHEARYAARIDQMRALHFAGVAVLSVGAATALAGAVRWIVVARSRRRGADSVAANIRVQLGGIACAF
jgi:hypothetical protein